MELLKKMFSQNVRTIWINKNPKVRENGFRYAGIYPYKLSVLPKLMDTEVLITDKLTKPIHNLGQLIYQLRIGTANN